MTTQLDPMTQAEVAKVLGLTGSRIGQIERAALLKLRRECKRRGIEAPADPTPLMLTAAGNRRRRPRRA